MTVIELKEKYIELLETHAKLIKEHLEILKEGEEPEEEKQSRIEHLQSLKCPVCGDGITFMGHLIACGESKYLEGPTCGFSLFRIKYPRIESDEEFIERCISFLEKPKLLPKLPEDV